MQYNAYSFMDIYYTYNEIGEMPLKELLREIEFFKVRFKEIAKKKEEEALKRELQEKRTARHRR